MRRVKQLGVLGLLLAWTSLASDWPMPHHDPARTGYTDDSVPLPAGLLWQYWPGDEEVSRHYVPVVAGGRAYLGTHAGNLHCVDAEKGGLLWKTNVGAPPSGILMHSPACAGDLVIAGSQGGEIHALRAADGTVVWKTALPGSIWASPLPYEGMVYVGDRAGTFHALDLRTGEVLWSFEAGAPIIQSAAAAGGRVFFGSEDIVVHCLDARTGRQIWKTGQLGGLSFREYWPVVAGERLIVTTMRGNGWGIGNRSDETFLGEQSDVVKTKWEIEGLDRGGKKRAPSHLALQPLLVDYLKSNVNHQTLYFLSVADGTSAGIPPAFHISGHGTAYPPVAVHRDGTVYLMYGLFRTGESQPAALGYATFDKEGIRLHELCRGNATLSGAEGLFTDFSVTDISELIIIGGDFVYGRGGQGSLIGAYDLKARKPLALTTARVRSKGRGNTLFHRGGTEGPPAIADDKFFVLVGTTLCCYGAPK